MLLPGVYAAIDTWAGSNNIYLIQFLTYPIEVCIILSHPLLYGFYMKKIRRRLPLCTICNCHKQWTIHRRNRVGILRQQPRAAPTPLYDVLNNSLHKTCSHTLALFSTEKIIT